MRQFSILIELYNLASYLTPITRKCLTLKFISGKEESTPGATTQGIVGRTYVIFALNSTRKLMYINAQVYEITGG